MDNINVHLIFLLSRKEPLSTYPTKQTLIQTTHQTCPTKPLGKGYS